MTCLSTIVKASAKINLGLYILGKRTDGYHDIETILYPVSHLYDTLRIRIVPTRTHSEFHLIERGPIFTSIPLEHNLIYHAYNLIKPFFPSPYKVQVELWKRIPIGAGLGGGSSNAAFFLSAIVKLLGLPLTIDKLHQLAEALGSDVPFFLYSQPMYATGKGTTLTPISLDLSAYRVRIIVPSISVSTSEAYALVKRYFQPPKPLPILLQETPVSKWKGVVLNQFEEVVFQKYPELVRLKQNLYQKGAHYVSLSGSGSAFFALFPNQKG